MNYSFKLSRRMARFRAALPIAAAFLSFSCAEDPSGPRSDTTAGPSSISISPESVSVGLNQAVQFGASADAGSLLSLSNSKGGNGRGRKAVVSVLVAPETTTVSTGASNRFSATSTLSDGSTVSTSLSWTATGGTIDQTGLYIAGKNAGKYHVIAAATNGMADTAAVTVATNAPTAVQVTLSPATETLVVGTTAQFTLTGKASDGSTVGASPVFAATGGTITSAGLYTAGQAAGTYRVIATDQGSGLADTAAITVIPQAIIVTGVSLSPVTVTLASGKTQQFASTATMSDGSTSNVAAKWTAAGGTISSTGLFTAGTTAGSYRVIAVDTAIGLADTAAVTITTPAPTLQAVVLTPTTVSLASGATQQFTASGKMSDGSSAPVAVSFAAGGGTISSTGLYNAGSTAGTYRVVATQSGGSLADTATVTITAPSAPPPSGGDTYFLADAESGTVLPTWASWGVYANGGAIAPTTSTARVKTGSRAWKFEITDPGYSPSSSSSLATNTPQTSMGCPSGHFCTGYYSFWAYVDAGFQNPAWDVLVNFLGVLPSADPIGHVGLGLNNGVLQLYWSMKNCQVGHYTCPGVAGYQNINGDYLMSASSPAGVVAFPRGQWVHVAIYYKLARTNGQVTIWQDGVKIEDITAPTLNTQDGNQVFNNTGGDMMIGVGIYNGPNADTNRRLYVDDIKVTNYRPVP